MNKFRLKVWTRVTFVLALFSVLILIGCLGDYLKTGIYERSIFDLLSMSLVSFGLGLCCGYIFGEKSCLDEKSNDGEKLFEDVDSFLKEMNPNNEDVSSILTPEGHGKK